MDEGLNGPVIPPEPEYHDLMGRLRDHMNLDMFFYRNL